MKVSKTNAAQARRIFSLCQNDGKLDGGKLKQAVSRIKESKPRGYLEILAGIKRLVQLELASKQVTVHSAQPLDDATLNKIKSDLSTKYGNDLTFSFFNDPSHLGGLKVRVGNDVWDGTVASRLKRLAESF